MCWKKVSFRNRLDQIFSFYFKDISQGGAGREQQLLNNNLTASKILQPELGFRESLESLLQSY